MMLKTSRLCNIVYLKGALEKQRFTNIVYIVISLFLLLFSIFNTLYPIDFRPRQPQTYDVENVAVQPISCSFPLSGQYHKAPRYTSYLLLVFTVIIRNHEWLAVGAAASVLTYTGVAAIHLVILFSANNKFKLLKTKSRCESIPLPGAGAPFLACAGVVDPDTSLSMNIVSSAMLGALPIAVWSTTFRKSTSRPILIYWLLLLAVGHLFSTWTVSDPNHHFQICSENNTEPPPGANYQAPPLDQVWHNALHSLVSAARHSSQALGNSPAPPCMYSCFATPDYFGRRVQDIGAYKLIRKGASSESISMNRRHGIMFWWAYTLLALLTLFITEKKSWLPHWAQKPFFSADRPLASRWTWKRAVHIAVAVAVAGTGSSAATSTTIHITVITLVQTFTKLVSVVAFCGSILVVETRNGRTWKAVEQEPFTAVGQWSCLAIVVLVLLAAGVSRMWAGRGAGSAFGVIQRLEAGVEEPDQAKAWSENQSSIEHAKDGSEDRDTELGKEDWDWRIGYAS